MHGRVIHLYCSAAAVIDDAVVALTWAGASSKSAAVGS